jgi:putative tricarboxylic transport membrane protein
MRGVRHALTFAAVLSLSLPAASAADPLLDKLLIVAPAAPGGGWDQTARAMQHALEREGLVRMVEVQNVAGAAGTIGLAQFVDGHRGDGAALLVTGLVMLGATIWNDSPVSLGQVEPVARLTGEYEVVAVPASSTHRSMRTLLDDMRRSPASVAWGGGSAGGTDHILAGLIGASAGIDPRRVNYIAFSGGGEAVAALLGANVTAGISSISEFAPHIASGGLRAIAVSSQSRLAELDAPTLVEQGVDVVLENWRGIVAPPGVASAERRRMSDVIAAMVQSETWRKTLADRGWIDTYLADAAFREYLSAERVRVTRIVSRLRGPAGTQVSRAGQRVFPILVFVGAAIVLLFQFRVPVRSTGSGSLIRTGTPNKPLVIVAIGLVAFVLLLEPLGFVVAASVLFFAAARALGGRWTSAAVGLAFAALVYMTFTRGLDLALPAGAAWAWIR